MQQLRTRVNTKNVEATIRNRPTDAKTKAAEAVRKFERAQEIIREFAEDNSSLFGVFLELADDYNAALDNAKTTLRGCSTKTPINLGPFNRAKDTTPVTTYAADRLPNSYLLVPGVVKEIDAKLVDALVKDGSFDAGAVKSAKGEKAGRAPSVRGPKEISVQL
jgi:hypothetical protein